MTYIAISYAFMLIWLAFSRDVSRKDAFKMWLMSPITAPVLLFITFLSW